MKPHEYFLIHKPFNVLSQFTSKEQKSTLKDFFDLPKDVYPVGRLDYDSEGLLILTNDKELNHQLLDPSFSHEREYWAEVEGEIDEFALQRLQPGVDISIDGKSFKTKPCIAGTFPGAPLVAERNPPIRFRKNIPTSWARLILTEGKNRQARKMFAKVGYPVLRLIRYRIEKITIDGLQPGEMRTIGEKEIYRLLSIGKEGS
ncbi:MAG TPA: pseudouridine synthase [Puia sp.]|jgi:23S rRNA pseudouridine2457 synthase|nr:pseudouridine synthase [Puia sp.]